MHHFGDTVPRKGHPLRPELTTREKDLQSALEEVCKDPKVQGRTTDELIQIEETLSIASETAKQAISLRKKIRSDEPPQLPPVA
jgi:hypothetical protein